MDQVACSLEGRDWTYLGGDADARKDLEVVVRAFDQDVDFAVGATADQPDGDTVRVPVGEGRRLIGRHFFARATGPGACRITQRGV